MQFLLTAYDDTDVEAPMRRQKSREAHLANMRKLKAAGQFLFGGAILDDQGAMIGSAIMFDFPDREAFDAWLIHDPYVTGKVWHKIEVKPFRQAKVE